MVDWLLELRGAETGAAAGQNDKNIENSDPVYFCKTSSCLKALKVCSWQD